MFCWSFCPLLHCYIISVCLKSFNCYVHSEPYYTLAWNGPTYCPVRCFNAYIFFLPLSLRAGIWDDETVIVMHTLISRIQVCNWRHVYFCPEYLVLWHSWLLVTGPVVSFWKLQLCWISLLGCFFSPPPHTSAKLQALSLSVPSQCDWRTRLVWCSSGLSKPGLTYNGDLEINSLDCHSSV